MFSDVVSLSGEEVELGDAHHRAHVPSSSCRVRGHSIQRDSVPVELISFIFDWDCVCSLGPLHSYHFPVPILYSLRESHCQDCGLPSGASGKESACQCRRHEGHGFDPWVRKIPWRREWQPTPVFLPGESPWTEEPGRLQLYSPWGHKELDTTECCLMNRFRPILTPGLKSCGPSLLLELDILMLKRKGSEKEVQLDLRLRFTKYVNGSSKMILI